MAAKFIILAFALAAAQAVPLGSLATSTQNVNLVSKHSEPIFIHGEEHDYYDPHSHYNFDYSVHDLNTGDIKSQYESKIGDRVEGSYSLLEADGSTRTVKYTADDHSGFNAYVQKQSSLHPEQYVNYQPTLYQH